MSKPGKITSTANLVADGGGHHQRKKSAPSPPSTSPRIPAIKRNNSHAILTRNATSHVNLRKNHSTTAINRNFSHPVLKKSGLGPPPKPPKEKTKTAAGFELGELSSDEDDAHAADEAEWEDSTSHSPELTRNSSLTSTHPKPATSDHDHKPEKSPDPQPSQQNSTDSTSEPSGIKNNHSAANLTQKADISQLRSSDSIQSSANPTLLQHNPRSSRAPPAMSSILAHATHNHLPRNSSSKSFTHITHSDAASSKGTSVNSKLASTPGVGISTSGDGAVSHFLSSSTPRDQNLDEDASDYDSPSNFLPNYHPQASTSPEKSRRISKPSTPHVPSRTQQRLELQRRETMRSAATTPSTTPNADLGLGFGSSASLHSRSGSRGRRDRSAAAAGDAKVLKRDYEAAGKHLSVVRRFRNPIVESLNRLKEAGLLSSETGIVTTGNAASALGKRPPSRRGLSSNHSNINGTATKGLSRSFEENRPSPMLSRSSSRGTGAGRVHFRRQGSHDDIGLSRSRGSYDEEVEDEAGHEDNGISAEEALLRRMWESREVYDSGEGAGN